jgi:Ca2+-binding RTX toxin-like protein
MVTITGTNDGPTVTSGSSATVAENAAIGTVVYDASATDPDAGDTVSFSLGGADAAAFNIDVTTGEVRLNASADFEAKASYAIDVIGTDVGGLTSTKAVTIGVIDVNEAPTAVLLSNVLNAIDENNGTASHIKVADIAVTDDALGTNILSLSGADASNFEVVGNALYLKAGVALDYETKTSYAVNVDVNDASVGTNPDVSQSFLLNVNNLPEGVAATDLQLVVDSIPNANGLPNGAFAHLAIVDTDGGGAHSFSMTTTVNGAVSTALAVDGATGVVSTTGLSAGTVYALAVQTTQAGATAYGETLYITTGTNSDNNVNGSGDDVIYALNGTDVVLAGTGDDTVFGQGGNDTLDGQGGNDILYGGGGTNQLTGGTGSDTFVFDASGTANALDFHATPTATEVDMVLLSGGFNNIANDASGHLSLSDFASVASGGLTATVGSGENIIFDRSTGNLYYDSNGGSSSSRALIGHIDVVDGTPATFDFNDIKVGP